MISPYSINGDGVVTGSYYEPKFGYKSFVRAADGTITKFSARGYATVATSIGGDGDIAGYDTDGHSYFGFLRAGDGTITSFRAPGSGNHDQRGTLANGINARGAIVGSYSDENFVFHGYVRKPGSAIVPFDVPGSSGFTVATAINNQGAVAGFYSGPTQTNGFLRIAGGTFTTYSLCAGVLAYSINDNNEIAGYCEDANFAYHGFLRLGDGAITLFDVEGAGKGDGQGTYAQAVNDRGDIVGSFVDANNVNHGFLRSADGTITMFDVPGAGKGIYQGTVARALNKVGRIAGSYIDSNGAYHGFVGRP